VLDTVVVLRHPQDYHANEGARFEVHFEKSRGFSGPDADSFEAKLTAQGWAVKGLSDVREANVLKLSDEGLKQREIAKELGMSAATVNRILKRARPAGPE
jgi:DNA-directed RNA polymerase specialized sigma24 family protein